MRLSSQPDYPKELRRFRICFSRMIPTLRRIQDFTIIARFTMEIPLLCMVERGMNGRSGMGMGMGLDRVCMDKHFLAFFHLTCAHWRRRDTLMVTLVADLSYIDFVERSLRIGLLCMALRHVRFLPSWRLDWWSLVGPSGPLVDSFPSPSWLDEPLSSLRSALLMALLWLACIWLRGKARPSAWLLDW